MRIKVKSVLAFNTVMARFAPNQSGKMEYLQNPDESITIFAVEACDVCGCECQGANPITIDKPRHFVLDGLAARKVYPSQIVDEIGCTEDGDAVCSECWAKSVNGDEADKMLLDIGEGGAG